MLKKRLFLSIIGFSLLVVILNFSFVSSALKEVSKVRLLSLSIIFSFLEIAIVAFILGTFKNSVSGFSKKERFLSLILNNMGQGILVHNSLNEILFLNFRAEEILGVKFKELAGMRLSQEMSLRNQKLKGTIEVLFFSRFSEEGKENFVVENFETSDDQQKFFVKILKKVFKDSNVASDVEFVTTAAHQLRTPLSGIKWVFKILLGKSGLSQDIITLLENGRDTNERAIKIVNDLLNTAKIESNKFSYEFKPTSVSFFVESVISSFSFTANEKKVRLIFDKGVEAIPNMKADSEKLSMVLSNLIDNAIKYTPSNGEIKVSLVRRNSFVEILVSDTGIGIPETEKVKVFSKFFRATNASKVDSSGSGLGLFIAYRIVLDHGGQMKFTPNSPNGSIFSFTVPLGNKY